MRQPLTSSASSISSSQHPTLLILDRDGVLNEILIDPEHGTIDSPLHPDQVKIFSWVPTCLARLTQAGFGLVVATNQPAATKGKTTQKNLIETHQKIIEAAQSEGGIILSSHICFHRHEDQCHCRKPKPGLLQQAFQAHAQYSPTASWMIGDGITDIEAGMAMQMKTAFVGPKKCDACRIFDHRHLQPTYWGKDLLSFTEYLLNSAKLTHEMRPYP